MRTNAARSMRTSARPHMRRSAPAVAAVTVATMLGTDVRVTALSMDIDGRGAQDSRSCITNLPGNSTRVAIATTAEGYPVDTEGEDHMEEEVPAARFPSKTVAVS